MTIDKNVSTLSRMERLVFEANQKNKRIRLVIVKWFHFDFSNVEEFLRHKQKKNSRMLSMLA